MDTSTICPVCLQENVYSAGYCRACKKKITIELPAGVLPPGVVLQGRYLTGVFLGSGGFGTIYKALDMATRRIVAVKEYCPSFWCHRKTGNTTITITSPEEYGYGLKHFNGEAEILRSLEAIPEVVRCYDCFPENNTGYYVMEYLDGETLQHYLTGSKEKLSFSRAVAMLMPAILGMHKVHQAGATHRDISPDNIFLCRDGSVRIIDFGASAAKDSKLSRSFIPVEKEGYSPPEQHTISSRGDMQGPWSDVYAMAGTVYRCTVGLRPPASSSRLAGDPLEFENSGLTGRQIETLEKGLSLKLDTRTQSMLKFARDLVDCLPESDAAALRAQYPELSKSSGPSSQLPPPPPPPPPPPKKAEAPSAKRAVAFALDLFFFQAVPAAVGALMGGRVAPWLLLGAVLELLITWMMTTSDTRGSPGQVLCGLEVTGQGGKPGQREALLYCLCRTFWPIALMDALVYLLGKKEFIAELSGCRSVLKGTGGSLALQVTNGMYRDSVIPLEAGRYVIGRNPERCNIVFPMAYNVVSRVHFELTVDASGQVTVTNLSSHGTRVGGRALGMNESAVVSTGTDIAFGNERMVLTYS